MSLPAGVQVRTLTTCLDRRGAFTEVFRHEWDVGLEPIQWNYARSDAGALRGVHVHPFHDDYFILLDGRATIGVRDLRRGSPTEGLAAAVEVSGEEISSVTFPRGVAHGSIHHEPTRLLVGVSGYYEPVDDELGCRWDDPDLGIPWPAAPTIISERDATAPSLARLLEQLRPVQPLLWRDAEVAASAAAR